MASEIAIPLPDGQWLALGPEALQAALARARELGLGASAAAAAKSTQQEALVDSETLGKLCGVHSTTIEAMAARGAIPSIRIGRALRFEPSKAIAAMKAT